MPASPGRRASAHNGVCSMNKEMIISSNGHDTRVAILEDDQVVEIFIERENQRGVVGNVYKGRVSKVLPGMQSSFVDIGLERDAFLYVSEVVTPAEFEKLEGGEDEDEPATVPVISDVPEPVAVDAAESQSGGAAVALAPDRSPERRSGGRRDDRNREDQ